MPTYKIWKNPVLKLLIMKVQMTGGGISKHTLCLSTHQHPTTTLYDHVICWCLCQPSRNLMSFSFLQHAGPVISSYLSCSLSHSPLVSLCSLYLRLWVCGAGLGIFIHELEFEPFSASGSVVRLVPTPLHTCFCYLRAY